MQAQPPINKREPPEPVAVNDFNGGLQPHPEISEPIPASEPPDHGPVEGRPHKGPKIFRRPNESVYAEHIMKLTEKVMVPVKDFPKVSIMKN